MSRIQQILVPWDFSNHANAALQYACQRFHGEAINVVCVLQPPNPYEPGFNWGPEAKVNAAKECEKKFRQEAARHVPDLAVSFHVAFGDPAEEILGFAGELEPDLIVISTHGRTGLQKLLMGSVAQEILGKSRFPMLLLPARWFDQHSPVTTEAKKGFV